MSTPPPTSSASADNASDERWTSEGLALGLMIVLLMLLVGCYHATEQLVGLRPRTQAVGDHSGESDEGNAATQVYLQDVIEGVVYLQGTPTRRLSAEQREQMRALRGSLRACFIGGDRAHEATLQRQLWSLLNLGQQAAIEEHLQSRGPFTGRADRLWVQFEQATDP